MNHLWSPWRAAHVEAYAPPPPGTGSVFSRIAASPERDAEHFVVWRGTTVFVVMNLYPYNNGHLLVVPYREVPTYADLDDDAHVEIARTIRRAMGWLGAALAPDGFNVGINEGAAAGAGIPEHLHVHVVPRWAADTNFMPTLAGTKVIPEAMRATYEKLIAAVDSEEIDSEEMEAEGGTQATAGDGRAAAGE
ncbi:MAG: HIT domain-containing protein [Bacteroidota bacterium]